jgi:hypothetical protein
LHRDQTAHATTPVSQTNASFQRMPHTDPSEQEPRPCLTLSKDALTVHTLTSDLARVGFTGEALRVVQRHGYLQDWTPERWARAERELEQALAYGAWRVHEVVHPS